MLVLMVRGLFHANLSGDQMFDPVWKTTSQLERLGFCMLALMFDGASPNRRFWKLHNKGTDLTYKVPNPYSTDRHNLFFISDSPHLLKTIRNYFFHS